MGERKGFYPLMVTAAIAVIIFSLLGIGAIMGWLPVSRSAPGDAVVNTTSKPDGVARHAAAECRDCGKIESIQVVSVQGKPSGIGVVTGGVVGGILGHQIGGGVGKDLATIGGAAGGAYLGNEMEKSTKKHTSFRIVVRMDDGTHRTLHSSTQNFTVGQEVQIINDKIIPVSSS